MKRVLFVAALCAAVTGVGARAYAQDAPQRSTEPEYAFDGHLLRIAFPDSTRVVDLGCDGRAALRQRDKLLVACGAAGVIEVDLSDPASPRRDGAMPVDGDATGLFLRDGRVWVEIAHIDARPVRIGTAGQPSPAVNPAITSSKDALAPLPPPPAPEGTAGSEPPREVATSAPPKESRSLVAPPRRGDLWELSFLSSAFIAIGQLGGGMLGSASVTYRLDAPIVLRASVTPFGVAGPSTTTSGLGGSTTGGAVTTAGAHVLVGIDTQFVEVGLGIGGATVNENAAPTGGTATGGVSIVEAARIGAHDGLALNFETSAVGANGQFNLGYIVSSVQIPLSTTAMLIIRGGGGNVGFAYGDIGVRVIVAGDGGKGTVALTGFVGGAAVIVDLCSSNPDPPFTTACNNSSLGGPSLGGGVEWRP